jgi:serine/threonine protein kinase
MTASPTTKPKGQVPSQWPPEVGEIYDSVRELGRGGFASVMLARKKAAATNGQEKDGLVAMKVVGGKYPTRQEVGYAHREIDILRELRHPNYVSCCSVGASTRVAHVCCRHGP